jgi:hypothetical protein
MASLLYLHLAKIITRLTPLKRKDMISVNLHEITTPRKEIPHTLPEILRFMSDKGWHHKLSTDQRHENIYIGFCQLERWHNRPTLAASCSFGYREKRTNAAGLIKQARRSAELCLTVHETFIDVIPSNPNAHGIIVADSIINKPKYSNITHEQFKAKHKTKELAITHSHQCATATFYGYECKIGQTDALSLSFDAANVRNKMAGSGAVTP